MEKSKRTTASKQPMGEERRSRSVTVAQSRDEAKNEATPRANGELIAMRAYELYLSRGASHGRDLDDWLQAERDLTERS